MAAPKTINCERKSAAAGAGGRQTIRTLDTCGCCFLCLTVVEFKTEDDTEDRTKTDDKRSEVEKTKNKSESQLVSLKSLRRYLKIDTDKLPGSLTLSATTGETEDSSSSLKKEEDIKVELCKSCAGIVNKFSKVFATLEMIQAEIHYWLEKVHKQIPFGVINDSSDERVQNYYQRRMTTVTSDADNESPDLFVFVDELRKEISMKCSKLKSKMEAKVELDSTGIPAEQKRSSVFVLLEDEPNSPTSLTSFQKFITERESSSDSDEFEGEDAEYFPSPEEEKDEVGNISESESSSSEFEGEEDTEYFPITEEFVKKPSKRQKSDKSAPHRGRGGPPLRSADDKFDQTKSSSFNSKTGKFNCKTCYRPFETRALASAHYKAAHLYVSYECELCRVTCSSLSHLNRHKKEKHGESNEEIPSLNVKIETETEDLSIPTSAKERKAAAKNAFIQRKKQSEERKKFFTFDSETKKYKCIACEFQFSRSQGAINHYESIHLKKGYECDICGATLSRAHHLSQHKLRMHTPGLPNKAPRRNLGPKGPVPKAILNPETGKYRCRECSEEFTTQYFVYAHFEKSHIGNTFKCDICNVLEFKRLSYLKGHQKICRDSVQKRLADKQRRETDPSYKFPCPTCGKRFKSKETVRKHLLITHASGPTHVCNICQKRFTSLSRVNHHKRCVHSGRRFCCKVCSKEYRGRTAYQIHERKCVMKTPDHPAVLEAKAKENVSEEAPSILKEEVFVFNSETGTFDCSVCQKPSKSEKSARVHYGSVHRQKSFLCDLCGKSYTNPYSLRAHKEICTGVKPIVVTKATLSRNLKIQKRLDEMKRKEGDQRKYPFRCSTCGFRFTRLYNLQDHQRRVHENEKAFECEICQRKFKSSASLRLHKKIIHFGKRYDCQFCKKEYRTKYGCQEHEKKCCVNENIQKEESVTAGMDF